MRNPPIAPIFFLSRTATTTKKSFSDNELYGTYSDAKVARVTTDAHFEDGRLRAYFWQTTSHYATYMVRSI